MFSIYILPFLIGLILLFWGVGYSYKKKNEYVKQFKQFDLQKEKLHVLNNIAASIAHELRTPLSTISIGAHNLRACMPQLLTAYQIAKEAKLPVPFINLKVLHSIQTSVDSIENEIQASFTFINMLLVNVNETSVKNSAREICLMSECVTAALTRSPFSQGE